MKQAILILASPVKDEGTAIVLLGLVFVRKFLFLTISFFSLCKKGKQTLLNPSGLVEDEDAAIGVLWLFFASQFVYFFRKSPFFSLQICEPGKQTIPIPAGLVEDEGAAMGLLWPFQIKKFPRQPIFSTPTYFAT